MTNRACDRSALGQAWIAQPAPSGSGSSKILPGVPPQVGMEDNGQRGSSQRAEPWLSDGPLRTPLAASARVLTHSVQQNTV